MSIWHAVIHPLTEHFRQRRGEFLLQRFPGIRSARICDLGGSRHFWDKLALGVPAENITIYNISETETQGVSDEPIGGIRVLLYDGKNIPEADGAFDLLICNSVMEHVPPLQRKALSKEMRRVAKKVFCQTPARSFPLEPHFLLPFVHWLPRWLGYQIIKISPWRLLARPDSAAIAGYWWGTQLLDRRELQSLFPEAEIVAERALGMVKSWYVIVEPRYTVG